MVDKKALKRRYRRLAKICEALWNEFDPIGVVDDEIHDGGIPILDEYSSYVPQTVRLVLDGADRSQFRFYIECVCEDQIGLTGSSSEIDVFTTKLAALAEAEAKSGHHAETPDCGK